MFFNNKTGFIYISKRDISKAKKYNRLYYSAILFDRAIRPYVNDNFDISWGHELVSRLIKNKYLDLSDYR